MMAPRAGRAIFWLAVGMLLAGCFDTAALRDAALVEQLAGRTVLYSQGDPATGRRPLYQSWNADGTFTVDRRPLLYPTRRHTDQGIWWVEGNRYCEAFPTPEGNPSAHCATVRLMEGGRAVDFDPIRTDLIANLLFPRFGWRGIFVPGRDRS